MAVAPLEQAPIGRALATCATALEEVRHAQPVYLRTEEKEAALLAIDQVAAQLDELRLRLIAAADDVADAHAARDPAAWLSHATLCDSGKARREQELARALDARWSHVAAGMAEGVVSLAQAQVTVEALEALPPDLDRSIVGKAEAELVAYAKDFDPRQLRVLGRKILDVVAPDIAEAEEAKRLEAEEQQARERTSLKHRVNGDGTTRFWGVLPDADFARLRTNLDAFTSPRKPRGAYAGEEDKIPYHRRFGQALVALLEHLNPAKLPAHGGTATMVMVTIPLAGLREDVATAGLLRRRPRPGRQPLRRPGAAAGLHRPDHPRRPRRGVRDPRPGPRSAPVHPRPGQGAPTARPTMSRRRLHHPRRVVRGPPPRSVVRRRPHRPSAPGCCCALGTTTASTTAGTPPRPSPPGTSGSTSGHSRAPVASGCVGTAASRAIPRASGYSFGRPAPGQEDDRPMPERDEELRLSELIGSLQNLLLSTHDLEGFLEGVAGVAGNVVEPPASCGITTRFEGTPRTVATSDARAAKVDECQYQTGSGPCLDALATGEPVEVTDQRYDERWPAYAKRAVELGVRCSLSLPLKVGAGETLGVLNIYGYERPREFGDEERRRVEVFAAQASTAIALAVQRDRQQDLAEQLEHALISRSVIDQAIGVIMAQEQCSARDAFQMLRQHSQNNNRKLRDVAADVITRLTGHPPDTPTPFERPTGPTEG